MIAVLLLMFVGGIGLAQAVSNPHQVTLRWLRLGGLISIGILAGCAVGGIGLDAQPRMVIWAATLLPAVFALGQLMTAQIGSRNLQRLCAALTFLAAAGSAYFCMVSSYPFSEFVAEGKDVPIMSFTSLAQCWLASGLLGGFLMTMLLGHAYLTAGGEMTQAPFLRLVKMLAILLALRTITSVAFGLWPYLAADSYPQTNPFDQMWNTVMLIARYLVGLVVPAVFTYMTWDCVRRRANQSATGILYVAGVLVIVGEGTALALLRATGLVF